MDDLVFVGIAGILDPPRPSAREAISALRSSKVDVKMLTGDSEETATSIGNFEYSQSIVPYKIMPILFIIIKSNQGRNLAFGLNNFIQYLVKRSTRWMMNLLRELLAEHQFFIV